MSKIDGLDERVAIARSTGTVMLIVLVPLIALGLMTFILPILAIALMESIGRPAIDYGWLAGASGLGTVSFFVVNHVLMPAWGPIGTMKAGLAVTLVGAVMLLTGGYPVMLGGSFLIGFGYATNTTAGSQVLADFTPKALWGSLFSLRQAAVPVGGILAAGIASLAFIGNDWQSPFVLASGIVAVTLGGLLLLPPRYNLNRELVPLKFGRLFAPANLLQPYKALLHRRGFARFVAAGCGLAVGHATVTQFFVIYMSSVVGLTVAQAASLLATQQITAVIGRLAFGVLADWCGKPGSVLAVLGPLSALACLVLVETSPSWPFAMQVAATVVIGLTAATWNGLYMAEVARLVPVKDVSSVTADMSYFVFISYMLTPPLFGLLVTTLGWDLAFEIAAAITFAAGLLLAARRSDD